MRLFSALALVSMIAGAVAAATPDTPAPAAPKPPVRPDVAKEVPMTPKTVAILLFDGVELMDFAGPAEVFILADKQKAFRVVTVAESTRPIKTMGGVTVTPEFSVETAPDAAIVVVPGGNMRALGRAGRDWIKKAGGYCHCSNGISMPATAEAPPSTWMICPVTFFVRGPRRKTAMLATSSLSVSTSHGRGLTERQIL